MSSRREFLEESLLAAAAAVVGTQVGDEWFQPVHRMSRDPVRVAIVGVRGRGRGHLAEFMRSKDSEVVALCDADKDVIGPAKKACPDAKVFQDFRKTLEDPAIHAISIATPNHWHSLATIWALQAGKHVYVEKPLSHTLHEGKKVVEAARKYAKIVQNGTQARSALATQEALAWMREGGLGKVHRAVAICYKRRESIGTVVGRPTLPPRCDYDLWTGPAPIKPLARKSLHYDWHWDYDTGNGDLGNQGVHQMDIARWGLGRNDLPKRVVSVGGRLGYVDDGNTPNTQIVHYDYGDQELIFEVRGLKTADYFGAHIGVVFHCAEGYLVSNSYEKVVAFDLGRKPIRTFTGGGNHFQNFLDAVKADKREMLTAESQEGHLSAALCHLGNISYRLAEPEKLSATDTPFASVAANETFGRLRAHLEDNGLTSGDTDYQRGPVLAFDPGKEVFVGERAQDANALARRAARPPFAVPDVV